MLSEREAQGVPIYSPLYAATEGLLGINVDAKRKVAQYTLHPDTMFFEFIPVEASEETQPKTKLLHEVWRHYELV